MDLLFDENILNFIAVNKMFHFKSAWILTVYNLLRSAWEFLLLIPGFMCVFVISAGDVILQYFCKYLQKFEYKLCVCYFISGGRHFVFFDTSNTPETWEDWRSTWRIRCTPGNHTWAVVLETIYFFCVLSQIAFFTIVMLSHRKDT